MEDGDSVAALPNIDEVLTELHLTELTMDLIHLSRPFYVESIVVVRNVRRIPLKVIQMIHLSRPISPALMMALTLFPC